MSAPETVPDPLPRLDPLLNDPLRLLISAALAMPVSDRMDRLAERTKVNENALFSAVKQLGAGDRVQTHRDAQGVTWVWLTEPGRARLIAHLRALRALLEKADDLLANC